MGLCYSKAPEHFSATLLLSYPSAEKRSRDSIFSQVSSCSCWREAHFPPPRCTLYEHSSSRGGLLRGFSVGLAGCVQLSWSCNSSKHTCQAKVTVFNLLLIRKKVSILTFICRTSTSLKWGNKWYALWEWESQLLNNIYAGLGSDINRVNSFLFPLVENSFFSTMLRSTTSFS